MSALLEGELTHEALLSGLWSSARAGRLPHALLFHGPEGIGKFAAARRLVQGLLCTADTQAGPCGACGACRRALSDNHLDVFVLDLAHEAVAEDQREARIKIDRVVRRGPGDWDGPVIEEFLGLRAAEGGWRAILMRDAEGLVHSQNEAQNALLKMLEEPGENVLWVLVTSHPQALLPTLRSRCVAVRLEPPDLQQARELLATRGFPGESGVQLARWGRGSPGVALELAARGARELRALLWDVLRGACSPLTGVRTAWEVEGDFRGKTPSARSRDRARAVIDLALDLVGDAARLAAGVPAAQLAHGDVLEQLVGALDEARVRDSLESLLDARADLERNLDAQGLVDSALLAVAAARPRGAA